jgi:hypothetical protein
MLTKAELIEVMDIYIRPFYWILGGIAAVVVILCACYLVISPFLRRL